MNMNGNRSGRMVPLQEYILQGSILDSSCEMLLHRLRGLCDNGDAPPEKFEDKEYVYSISKWPASFWFQSSLSAENSLCHPIADASTPEQDNRRVAKR